MTFASIFGNTKPDSPQKDNFETEKVKLDDYTSKTSDSPDKISLEDSCIKEKDQKFLENNEKSHYDLHDKNDSFDNDKTPAFTETLNELFKKQDRKFDDFLGKTDHNINTQEDFDNDSDKQ